MVEALEQVVQADSSNLRRLAKLSNGERRSNTRNADKRRQMDQKRNRWLEQIVEAAESGLKTT